MFRLTHARRMLTAVTTVTIALTANHLCAQVLSHSAAIGGVKQRFKNAQNDPGDAEKQWKQSIELLEKTIVNDTKDKDREETYFYLGSVYYRVPDFEKAYEAFRKALTFGKRFYDTGDKVAGGIQLFSIKDCLNDMKLKTFAQGNRAYNEALGISNPDSAKLDSLRKSLYKGIAKFQQVLAWDSLAVINDKSYVTTIYLTLANSYIQLVNFETEEGNRKPLREKILENLIRFANIDTKNFSVAYNIFNLYLQEKNYDQCIHWIDRALAIDVKDSTTLAVKTDLIGQKALIYDVTGKHGEALRIYLEAIKADPNNADLHFNLARLYLDSNKTDLALAEFKIVKRLKPKDVLSNYKIANEGYKAYQITRRSAVEKFGGNPKKVSETLKPAIDNAMQDLKDAVDALEAELPTASDKAESYFIIGTAYNYMAQLAGDKVYELENKDKIKSQRPHFEKAVENLKKAVELKPQNKNAWIQLGTAYLNLQMKKEAEAAFDKGK